MSESAEHDDTVNELPGVPQVIRDAAKLSKGFNSMNLLGPAGKVAYEQIAKQLDTVAKITGETPKYPFATPVPHVLPAIDPQIIANSPEMRTARQTASMAEALDTMRLHVDAARPGAPLSSILGDRPPACVRPSTRRNPSQRRIPFR